MKQEYKERLLKLIKPIGEILLLGFGYYLLVTFTNFSIPCPIEFITGKYCPGCGISRMLIAFLENNLVYENGKYAIRIPEALRPYMGGKELIEEK